MAYIQSSLVKFSQSPERLWKIHNERHSIEFF